MDFWQFAIALCAVVTASVILLGTSASEALRYSAVLGLLLLLVSAYMLNELIEVKKRLPPEKKGRTK